MKDDSARCNSYLSPRLSLGKWLSRKEKRTLKIWFVIILLGGSLGLATAIFLQYFWAIIVVSAVIAFDLYWFYVRYHKKTKPRYPLVPPERAVDAYFPRTDIPRPIYADAIKMREKQKTFAKIKKMRLKKK